MQTLELAPPTQKRVPNREPARDVPAGCELQQIAFVQEPSQAGVLLREFSQPTACRAVLVSDTTIPADALATLELLWVPCREAEATAVVESAWQWVEPGVPTDARQAQLITLHGARILWLAGRAAVIAPLDRLPQLRLALVEFAYYEAEVLRIEQSLAPLWPEMEQDGALAFQFDDRAAAQRERLAQRFQELLGHRSRLVRLIATLHRPPVHPPTLASQLAERLKERTRLVERADFLDNQVEVFERVYDMCAQRSSDYFQSRKETTLEWIIIVLLGAELVVLLVDMMSSLGT